jgi:hypothetical protein
MCTSVSNRIRYKLDAEKRARPFERNIWGLVRDRASKTSFLLKDEHTSSELWLLCILLEREWARAIEETLRVLRKWSSDRARGRCRAGDKGCWNDGRWGVTTFGDGGTSYNEEGAWAGMRTNFLSIFGRMKNFLSVWKSSFNKHKDNR